MAKSNGFNPYPFHLEGFAKIMRQRKIIPLGRVKPLEAARLASQHLIATNPELLHTMDLGIHAEEANWLRGDRVAYYPATAAVAHNLIKSSFKLADPSVIFRGNESFTLNLPKDLIVGGYDAGSGLLVTICANADRETYIFDPFFDWIEHRRIPVTPFGPESQFFIAITYRGLNDDAAHRVCIPDTDIGPALECKSVEEYQAFMRKMDKFTYVNKIDSTDDELKYQYDLVRLVCGLLIYRHALPERIYEGLPGKRKQFETPLTIGQSGMVIHQPKGHQDSPSAHYRSWHFRQLSHEKYYRGKHTGLAKGSRIVFVPDCVVGQEQSPLTVEGQ